MEGVDAQLVRAAQADRKAFGALYRKYRPSVYRYCWYHTDRDQALAEDLTEETFLRAFAALPRFRWRGYPYQTYLLTIAHNAVASHFRKPRPVPIEYAERIPDDPTDRLAQHVDAIALWEKVSRLPPSEQQAILLKYQQGRSIADIARILGRTPNAVKLLLSRSRHKLRVLVTMPARLAQRVLRQRPRRRDRQ